MRASPALLIVLLPALAMAAPAPPAADSVRIYRCVGSDGAVTLQDSPCSSGRQEVRQMQRPQDPPPRRASTDDVATPAASSAQVQREIRHVYVRPPQPMFECVTEEGRRYLSDSNEGNPRWVPLWTSAWVGGGHRPWHGPGQPGLPPIRAEGRGNAGPGQRPPHGIGHGISFPAGNILVRDTCNALPPQEVCARLRDQRWELDRRYNSALQGERQAITREQRGIDARLDQDCGGR
ncbi:DUF4124 domain-containing protein [Stenotrophomonas sp. Sa5BUN4]|uniref:DUF4124 domain-containing protein n=1 Tax=Stenotrophomonas lacuserhaii TaxID=2760084 RepID=A0A8X8FKJ4_9GAMM|nr:DUF4124 domain-containing protein [Stenotrophomonas pennii]